MIDRIVVLNDVSRARGGATSLALASIHGFRARGIPVTFITGDDGDATELPGAGVEVVALHQSLLLVAGMHRTALRGLYNPRTVTEVGDWVRQNDTAETVYHVHTWSKILSPSLFYALRPVSARLLISAHDYFLTCPNGGYVSYRTSHPCALRPLSGACILATCDKRSYPQKLWRVARQAVRHALFDFANEPARVLAIHDGMRSGLERGGIPPSAIRTLRNPIRPFSRQRIPAERNRKIVFIGRLDREKGADLAAEAARDANAALHVIGDGPMRQELERSFPEVTFAGHLPHEGLAALVASARALVMPSRYPEPFGLVAGEALWSGLPVILPSTALMAPEIVAREAGLAYDPGVTSALPDAMCRLLDSDEATRAMSVNAFHRTRDLGLTPEGWIDALLAAYAEQVAR